MSKSIVRFSLLTVAFLFAAVIGFTQSQTLAVSTTKPVVDGSVADNEYSFQQDFGKLKLYLNRTEDTLSIAVVGNTTGWVAVGLGSLKMDGDVMFIGFVADGKVQFKIQQGVGHRHQDVDAKDVTDSLIASAMKEDAGKTVLEIALKADSYIKKDQTGVNLIFAIGSADAFTPIHTYRGALAVKLS